MRWYFSLNIPNCLWIPEKIHIQSTKWRFSNNLTYCGLLTPYRVAVVDRGQDCNQKPQLDFTNLSNTYQLVSTIHIYLSHLKLLVDTLRMFFFLSACFHCCVSSHSAMIDTSALSNYIELHREMGDNCLKSPAIILAPSSQQHFKLRKLPTRMQSTWALIYFSHHLSYKLYMCRSERTRSILLELIIYYMYMKVIDTFKQHLCSESFGMSS